MVSIASVVGMHVKKRDDIIGYHGLLSGSIKFNTVYLYSTFYNQIVSWCFTEPETQSQNPQVSTVARKNCILTGRNLEQEPSCRVGWVKE